MQKRKRLFVVQGLCGMQFSDCLGVGNKKSVPSASDVTLCFSPSHCLRREQLLYPSKGRRETALRRRRSPCRRHAADQACGRSTAPYPWIWKVLHIHTRTLGQFLRKEEDNASEEEAHAQKKAPLYGWTGFGGPRELVCLPQTAASCDARLGKRG